MRPPLLAGVLGAAVILVPALAVVASLVEGVSRTVVVAVAVAALLGILVLWILVERAFLRRLGSVVSTSERLAAGDLSARTGIAEGGDRVGELAVALDRMAENLEQLRREDARRAEREVRETENRLRLLTEHIEGALWIWDGDQERIVYLSPGFEKIWARERSAVYGHPKVWIDSIHPEDRDRVVAASRARTAAGGEIEYRIQRPDGEVRWILDRAFAVRNRDGKVQQLAGVAQDITERKQLEEQLHQSRKLEALGRLAGGIAHDFNNVLTAIRGNAQLLLGQLDSDAELRREAMEIDRAAERAASLTGQLLAFSRKQALRPTLLDPNEVIEGMMGMLRRLIGENIALETQLDGAVGRIRVDRSQIEQILINLAANARDAMPGGGVLTVATESVPAPDSLPVEEFGVPADRHFLRLSVSDTGQGMTPEVRERVFEPFFTTKELGRGTGLGLASVYGVVKQSGGYIWVASDGSSGTTFSIYFPEADREEGAGAAEVGTAARSGDPRSAPVGSETVLVVEDEEAVRRVVCRELEQQGYRVIAAQDGAEALETFERHQEEVELLLTDVVMPRLNGPDLYEVLRNTRPGLKVLYMSGYARDASGDPFLNEAETALLRKPFTPVELGREVRRVLDGEAAGRAR